MPSNKDIGRTTTAATAATTGAVIARQAALSSIQQGAIGGASASIANSSVIGFLSNPWTIAVVLVISILAGNASARRAEKKAIERARSIDFNTSNEDAGRPIPRLVGRSTTSPLLAFQDTGKSLPVLASGRNTVGSLSVPQGSSTDSQRRSDALNEDTLSIYYAERVISEKEIDTLLAVWVNRMNLAADDLRGRFLAESVPPGEIPQMGRYFEQSGQPPLMVPGYRSLGNFSLAVGNGKGRRTENTRYPWSVLSFGYYYSLFENSFVPPFLVQIFTNGEKINTIESATSLSADTSSSRDPFDWLVELIGSEHCALDSLWTGKQANVSVSSYAASPTTMVPNRVRAEAFPLWRATVNYAAGDGVTHGTELYVAVRDNVGIQPDTSVADWSTLAGNYQDVLRNRGIDPNNIFNPSVTASSSGRPFHSVLHNADPKRWEVNGRFEGEETKSQRVNSVMQCIPGGKLFRRDGKYRVKTPDWETAESSQSIFTLRTKDLYQPTVQSVPDTLTRIKQGVARYENSLKNGAPDTHTFPRPRSALAGMLSGQDRVDFELPLTDNQFHAQDIVGTNVFVSQRDPFTVYCKHPIAMMFEQGDVIRVEDDIAGTFSYMMVDDDVDIKAINQIEVKCVYFDRDDYAPKIGENITFDPQILPNFRLLAPTNVRLPQRGITSLVQWDITLGQPADTYRGHEIEIQVDGGEWIGVGQVGGQASAITFNLTEGTHQYKGRVKAIGTVGNESEWAESSTVELTSISAVGPFRLVRDIPLGGCPDDDDGFTGETIFDEVGKVLYNKGLPVWNEIVGAGRTGVLTRFEDASPTLTQTSLTIDAPNAPEARIPNSALTEPPGYIDNIVVSRTTGRVSFDLKGTATGTATDDEELSREFVPLVVIALRDTAASDDPGIAFIRDTPLSGDDPYSYTPVNASEVVTWLSSLSATSDIEAVLLNVNRRCQSDPLNRWYVLESSLAAKYRDLTVYRTSTKGLPLTAADRPTGSFIFSLDFLSDISPWTRSRPRHRDNQIVWATSALANTFEGNVWNGDQSDWTVPEVVGVTGERIILYRRSLEKPTAPVSAVQLPTRQDSAVSEPWEDSLASAGLGRFGFIWITYGTRDAIGDEWVWTEPSKLEGQKHITLFTTLPGVAPPSAGEVDQRRFPAVPALADYNSVTETFRDDADGNSTIAPWSPDEPIYDELQRVAFVIEGYLAHGPQPAGVWTAPAVYRPVYRSRIIYRRSQERPPPPAREPAFLLGTEDTTAEPASSAQGLLAPPQEPSGGVSGQIDVVGQQAVAAGIASIATIPGGVYIIMLSPILATDELHINFLTPSEGEGGVFDMFPASDVGFLDSVSATRGGIRNNDVLDGGAGRRFVLQRGGPLARVDIGNAVEGVYGSPPLLVQTIAMLTATPGHEQITFEWTAVGAPVPARFYQLRYRGIGNFVTEPLPPEIGQDDLWVNADVVEASGNNAPAIGRAFQLTAPKATTTVHGMVHRAVPLTVSALVRVEGALTNIDGVRFGLEPTGAAPPAVFVTATASNDWTLLGGTITVSAPANTPGVQVDANNWPLATYGDDGDVVSANSITYTKQTESYVFGTAVFSLVDNERQLIQSGWAWEFIPVPTPQLPADIITGTQTAYAALLRLGSLESNGRQPTQNHMFIQMSSSPTGTLSEQAGPHFTADAISKLALVLRDGRNRSTAVALSTLLALDTVEPYIVPIPAAIRTWLGGVFNIYTPGTTTNTTGTRAIYTIPVTNGALPSQWGTGLTLTQITVQPRGSVADLGHTRATMTITGGNLSDEVATSLRIRFRSWHNGRLHILEIPGPNAARNSLKDTTAPYAWTFLLSADERSPMESTLNGFVGGTDAYIALIDEDARVGSDYFYIPIEGRDPNNLLNPWVVGGVETVGLRPFVERLVKAGETAEGLVQFSDFTIHDDANKPDWIELQVANNQQTITGLSNNESYEGEVRAVSALGNTAWQTSTAVLPRRPNAPTAATLRLATTNDAVSLEWEEVPDELSVFKVQVAALPAASGAVSGQQAPPPSYRDVVTGHRANTYIARDLLQGDMVVFRVESTNPGGTTAGPASDPYRIGYSEDGLRMPPLWFDHPPQGAFPLWSSKQELITNKNTGAMFYRYERPLAVRGEVDDRDLREVGEWQVGANYRDGDIAFTRSSIDFETQVNGQTRVVQLMSTQKWVCIRPHMNATAASRPTNNANQFWRNFDPGLEADIRDNPSATEVADTTADHGLDGKTVPFDRIMPGFFGPEYQADSPGEVAIGSLLNGVFSRLGAGWANALGGNVIELSFFDPAGNDNTFFHRSVGGAVVQGTRVEVAIVDGLRWIKYQVLQARETLDTNRCWLSVLPIESNSRGDTSDLSNDGSLVFSLAESLGETIPSSRTERRYRLSSMVLNRLSPLNQGISEENHLPLAWQYERPNPTISQDVWRIQRISSYRGSTFQSATPWGAPVKVQDRITVVLTPEDYIFMRGDPDVRPATPVTPDAEDMNAAYLPAGWSRRNPRATVTLGVWRSVRTITRSGTGVVISITQWERPTLVADAIGDATQASTRYIFIAQSTRPATPATSETVPPAGWTDGRFSADIPGALLAEPTVWVSQRVEQRYIADPTSVASFGAWSVPSNARSAVVPTVELNDRISGPPPRYNAVDVIWGAFQNPSSISLVEAQIQVSDDGATWAAGEAWLVGVAGSGSGGRVDLRAIIPGKWIRARTRALFTSTLRGDPSAWSAGIETEREPLAVPSTFGDPGPTITSLNDPAPNRLEVNLLVIPPFVPPLPAGTTWSYQYRVAGDAAWIDSNIHLPATAADSSNWVLIVSTLTANRTYEFRVRNEPNTLLFNDGYTDSAWLPTKSADLTLLATPPAPTLTAVASGITVAAPTTVTNQTHWAHAYRLVGGTTWTTTSLLANGTNNTITGLTAGTYEVRLQRVRRAALGSLWGAAAQVTVA